MNELGGASSAGAQLELVNSKEVHDESSEVKEEKKGQEEENEQGGKSAEETKSSEGTEEKSDAKHPDNEAAAPYKRELGDKEFMSRTSDPSEDVDISRENSTFDSSEAWSADTADLPAAQDAEKDLPPTSAEDAGEKPDQAAETARESQIEAQDQPAKASDIEQLTHSDQELADAGKPEETVAEQSSLFGDDAKQITLDCSDVVENSEANAAKPENADQEGFGAAQRDTESEHETAEQVVKTEPEAAEQYYGENGAEQAREEASANPEADAEVKDPEKQTETAETTETAHAPEEAEGQQQSEVTESAETTRTAEETEIQRQADVTEPVEPAHTVEEAEAQKQTEASEKAEPSQTEETTEAAVTEAKSISLPDDFETKATFHAGESEQSNEPREVSEQLQKALEPFSEDSWKKLEVDERKEAIETLRDAIATELNIQDKPNVDYYHNADDGDFGGYSASENTIYINEYNLSDAKETADTVAHESRHCWQHECADNPITEQDYVFKENFEDYIRPEDDFYEYQRQPVEADARDYAQNVRDAIPISNDSSDMEAKRSYEGSDYKVNNDTPPSTTGPPETLDEKLEPTQVPDDLDRKVDIILDEQKIADFNKIIADISEDPSLDSREKAENIANELNSIGFDKVDETTVLGFTDQKIEIIQMDGSQMLYRRGYDTEGQGGYGYGSWWSEEPMSIDDTRNKLAVCESWGNPLTGEYQSKPEKGTLALKGTAAPQDTPTKDGGIEHRDGGATQYYIETPSKEWCSKAN